MTTVLQLWSNYGLVAGWSRVSTAKYEPKNDGTTALVQYMTPVDESGNVINGGPTSGSQTPAAGTASAVTTGGTAVTAISGPIKGGYITNPPNLASQGIAAAENLYADPVAAPGSTDSAANGTTSILQPGQTYLLPALASGSALKVNAATNGHKFTIVVW